MKKVCSVVNETKRRVEKLEDIADWQSTVDGWEVGGRCMGGAGGEVVEMGGAEGGVRGVKGVGWEGWE